MLRKFYLEELYLFAIHCSFLRSRKTFRFFFEDAGFLIYGGIDCPIVTQCDGRWCIPIRPSVKLEGRNSFSALDALPRFGRKRRLVSGLLLQFASDDRPCLQAFSNIDINVLW